VDITSIQVDARAPQPVDVHGYWPVLVYVLHIACEFLWAEHSGGAGAWADEEPFACEPGLKDKADEKTI